MTAYYFAARYSAHPQMRAYRAELTAVIPGAEVTSRWIDCHGGDYPQSFPPELLNAEPQFCWALGAKDLADIDVADVVVSITGEGGKGGRHVEFGYALARGKRLVVVGRRENVFHTAPQVEVFPTWQAFLAEESGQSAMPSGDGAR